MATNKPYGDGHRNGAVRQRSQVMNDTIHRFVKRDRETGKFISVKSNNKPYKGIRKEK